MRNLKLQVQYMYVHGQRLLKRALKLSIKESGVQLGPMHVHARISWMLKNDLIFVRYDTSHKICKNSQHLKHVWSAF